MVFRGKPSKACERCRARRLRVSPKSGNRTSLDLKFDFECSAIYTLTLVANVSEPVCLVRDTGIHSNFGFKMKVCLL